MTPQQTVLLAFADAQPTGTVDADVLAAFNASLPGQYAHPALTYDIRTALLAVPVGDTNALRFMRNSTIPAVQDVVDTLDECTSIDPSDPRFSPKLTALVASGLLPPNTITALLISFFGKVSLASQAGFTSDATQADLDGARAEQAAQPLADAKLAANQAVDAWRDRRVAQREAWIAQINACTTVAEVLAIVIPTE
jgi:hypothetical protein